VPPCDTGLNCRASHCFLYVHLCTILHVSSSRHRVAPPGVWLLAHRGVVHVSHAADTGPYRRVPRASTLIPRCTAEYQTVCSLSTSARFTTLPSVNTELHRRVSGLCCVPTVALCTFHTPQTPGFIAECHGPPVDTALHCRVSHCLLIVYLCTSHHVASSRHRVAPRVSGLSAHSGVAHVTRSGHRTLSPSATCFQLIPRCTAEYQTVYL
jgi:hypothetical protein